MDKWRQQGFYRFHSHENRIKYLYFPHFNLISSLHHVSRVGMTKFAFRDGLLMQIRSTIVDHTLPTLRHLESCCQCNLYFSIYQILRIQDQSSYVMPIPQNKKKQKKLYKPWFAFDSPFNELVHGLKGLWHIK